MQEALAQTFYASEDSAGAAHAIFESSHDCSWNCLVCIDMCSCIERTHRTFSTQVFSRSNIADIAFLVFECVLLALFEASASTKLSEPFLRVHAHLIIWATELHSCQFELSVEF